MKSKRGQRGSIRVEGGSFVGYWNTYHYNPHTDERIRKQASKSLGPKAMGMFAARKKLEDHIARTALPLHPCLMPALPSKYSHERAGYHSRKQDGAA
jgi:hypothetical protein